VWETTSASEAHTGSRSQERQSRLRSFIYTRSITHLAVFYATIVTISELLTTFATPLLGSTSHLFVFGLAIAHGATEPRPRAAALWLSLSLVPLIRVISLGLPLGAVSQEWWYLLAAIPLMGGAITAARVLGMTRADVGLQLPGKFGWLLTGVVALCGVLIGIAEHSLLGASPAPRQDTMVDLLFFLTILIVGTGIVEEVIFRGVIHAAAVAALGVQPGIVLVSVLFAVMHLGHGSFLNIIFLFGVALYFGHIRQQTGSLLGVILAHATANFVLLILMA
jgi:uncharacterized protein